MKAVHCICRCTRGIVMTVQFLMKFQYMNILHYVYIFLIKLIKICNIFYPILIFEIYKLLHYDIERITYIHFLQGKIKTFLYEYKIKSFYPPLNRLRIMYT